MNESSRSVWDLPTRLFHWSIVLLVLAQWVSAEWNLLSMDWHFRFGYATLTLVLFRIAWGFVGSQSARFATFLRGPRAIADYVPHLASRSAPAHAGHNPLGGWSALALILLLLAQGVTGLFSSDDISLYGPLAERVSADTMDLMTRLHKQSTDVLLILIGLHLLAIAFHTLWKRERLVAAMFSGRKALPADPNLRFAGNGRALLVLAATSAVVWAVVWFGAG
jgi:cytochrome b